MVRRRPRSAASSLETIRIVLVESRALAGLGIRGVLDGEPDLEVVAEVRSADDALAVAEESAPDVFILDVQLQEPSTSAATHRLAKEAPSSGIVVVGREDDDASILEAVEIGAMGHVAAVAEPAELVAVIRKVADGEDPLRGEVIGRPDLIDKITEAFQEISSRAEGPQSNPLTPRELDILRHVAGGMRNRDIGGVMDVSEQTVKNHVTTILHKLGVPNRVRAVTFAARHGWLALDEVGADVGVGTQDEETAPVSTARSG
jgi:DNA-binding NarL/FixJ family response regulator